MKMPPLESTQQRLMHKLPFIICGVLIGLISVAFAQLSEEATALFIHFYAQHPVIGSFLPPFAFVGARYLVQRYEPAAAGSGIPQLMAALETDETEERGLREKLLNLRLAAVKMASNILALLGGAIVGREGPMVQIGASLFLAIGVRFRRFIPKVEPSTLMVSGGAAGIAAAFNTPLGGIVFAIEELISHHFAKVRSAMLLAVILAGMVAQSLTGSYLVFGSVPLEVPGWRIILPTLMVAAALGLLGGVTNTVFIRGQTWLTPQKQRVRLIMAGVCGVVVSLLLIAMPVAHGAGGGIPLIREMIWSHYEVTPLLAFGKWLGMLASFLSGVAGGFFAPSLAVGAAFGKLATALFPTVSATQLILIGMVSFLAANTHAPFTSLVLVSEMSNGHVMIMPLMLASLVGLSCSRMVETRSYYEFQAGLWLQTLRKKPVEAD